MTFRYLTGSGRAKKTVVDGITFASKREADRYCTLRWMQQAGEIGPITTQPKFLLWEGGVSNTGEKLRPIHYNADFQYRAKGDDLDTVEDVKPPDKKMRTEEYKIKRKLFLAKYPQYLFKET